jgi:hypothetical protein
VNVENLKNTVKNQNRIFKKNKLKLAHYQSKNTKNSEPEFL